MAVSKALRFQIFRRDDNACQYCGGRPPDVALVVDHVVPRALGGSDDPTNLTTSCRDCNGGKSATPPDAPIVAAVSERQLAYKAEMDRLAQEAHEERSGSDLEWFTKKWESYHIESNWAPHTRDGEHLPLPMNWANSIRIWMKRGLVEQDILFAIERTMTKADLDVDHAFRYMAAICWNTLSQREEAALKALGEEE